MVDHISCFLIGLVDVEQQICPVLIELCSIDSTDDFRTEAVTVSAYKCILVQKSIFFYSIFCCSWLPNYSLYVLFFTNTIVPNPQYICTSPFLFLDILMIVSTLVILVAFLQLMSKMAPMVGREITEQYFLGQFDNLCSDPLFHVRKVTKQWQVAAS